MSTPLAPSTAYIRSDGVHALFRTKNTASPEVAVARAKAEQGRTRSRLEQMVAQLPLFRNLEEARLERIVQGASVRRFAQGETLFSEGQHASALHLMLSGLVELFTTDSGRDRTVLVMSRGDIFMPAAAVGGEPYLLSARPLGPSKVLLLDAAALRLEMETCPLLASRMANVIAGQFRMVVRHLKDLKTRTGPQRLAGFLLGLIDESPIRGSAELPFPKRTLASLMGMSAESLSRSIQILAEHGLLIKGCRVLLLDRDRIEHFCHPDPAPSGSFVAPTRPAQGASAAAGQPPIGARAAPKAPSRHRPQLQAERLA